MIYSVKYLLQNDYTDTFAPSVDLISRINLSPGNVLIEASKLAKITSEKIALEGYTTINKSFGVDLEGNMFAKDGTFEGTVNTGKDCNVGDALYIGKNQDTIYDGKKYIYLTENSYIERNKMNMGSRYVDEIKVKSDYITLEGNISHTDGQVNFYEADGNDTYIRTLNQFLHVAFGYIEASSEIVVNSDKRLKKEIKGVNVDWIDDLKVKEYEYKNNPNKKHIGLIAQDYLGKDYSKYFLNEKENGYYGIAYNNITNALIQYCQNLNKKINKQQEEIDILKKEMEGIKNGVNRI